MEINEKSWSPRESDNDVTPLTEDGLDQAVGGKENEKALNNPS